VELDGAAWHGSAAQRERDVRRDAALAASGWLVVRFTQARLHRDPEGCRRDLLDILASRRRQLRIS
jgi:very-short-patch-repair endonuclease